MREAPVSKTNGEVAEAPEMAASEAIIFIFILR